MNGVLRPRVHELKTVPWEFNALAENRMTCQLRRGDRPFKKGDWLRLQEYEPDAKALTGQSLYRRITDIIWPGNALAGIEIGYCILSIEGDSHFPSGVQEIVQP